MSDSTLTADQGATGPAVGLADDTSGACVGAAAPPRPAASPPEELWFRRRLSLSDAVRDVWRFRELILSLAERDYRARYKQAVLGLAWSVLTPVALMLIFTLVFTKFQRFDTGGAPYVLFSYLGLLPWTFFSSSVSSGGQSITANMSLVNKVACPREVFPLAAVAVAAIDTVISSAVLLVLFLITGFAPKPETVYAPLYIAVLLVYTIGVTVIVSAVLVYLRDLRHMLPLLLQIGLFATPVAYGIEVIANTRPKLVIYSFLNPVAPVIDGLRRSVLYGLGPDWALLGAGALGAALVLVVGFVLFKKLEVAIADIA
jgi:ABC-type polysaccharide/polyol phosphate export permease